MAQVTLKINGHAHAIFCKDGEEAHLTDMGEQIDKRIERVKALGAHNGEARLLVMAALLMADELHDMSIELENLKKVRAATPEKATDKTKAERLNRLAARAEEIAASAERH